jgi:hypothetical protein
MDLSTLGDFPAGLAHPLQNHIDILFLFRLDSRLLQEPVLALAALLGGRMGGSPQV